MRTKAWFLAGILAVLAGCEEDGEEGLELPPAELTPSGYWATIPGDSAIPKADIVMQLEARIDEWIYSHPEKDESYLRSVALSYQYIIHDSYKFASESSSTGYASGECWIYDPKHIKLALYAGEEKWAKASLEGGLPATGHELDHAIGVHHD